MTWLSILLSKKKSSNMFRITLFVKTKLHVIYVYTHSLWKCIEKWLPEVVISGRRKEKLTFLLSVLPKLFAFYMHVLVFYFCTFKK